jgi:hypothetical protein
MKEDDIPTSYRGIEFSDWLDTFLRYALCLAKRHDITAAYEVINAAYDANVFHHSKDASFLIHVCWAGMVYILLFASLLDALFWLYLWLTSLSC